MLHSLNCFVDPISSGLIRILPDSTAGLLRFKCVLTLIIVLMMVSVLKPIYVGRDCHNVSTPQKFPSVKKKKLNTHKKNIPSFQRGKVG